MNKEQDIEKKTEAKTKMAEKKLNWLKWLFGGIKLSWPRLVLAAVAIGVLVGVLMTIPALKDTAWTQIGVIMYWWVFFGVIIIANSKSNLDSALKCFVFFLISQPLIYLTQVLIGTAGWQVLGFYRYWFLWTLATLPMGYVGYWIKRKDAWAAIILTPMIALMACEALGSFKSAAEEFPGLLWGGIMASALALLIVIGVLDDWRWRAIPLGAAALFVIFALMVGNNPANYSASGGYELRDYGVSIEKEWALETDVDESKIWLDTSEEYDMDGDLTGKEMYVLRFDITGENFGEHPIKLTSGDDEVDCTLVTTKQETSFHCE